MYLRMDLVKFAEDSLQKICPPKILLGPFLNTLAHLTLQISCQCHFYTDFIPVKTSSCLGQ